ACRMDRRGGRSQRGDARVPSSGDRRRERSMKEFLYLKSGLRSLQWSTRFVYTVFLLFSLAGYAVMIALAAQRSGFGADSIAAYYAGDGSRQPAIYAKTTGE